MKKRNEGNFNDEIGQFVTFCLLLSSFRKSLRKVFMNIFIDVLKILKTYIKYNKSAY